MQPLVSKMLQADGVTAGSVLLVDSVNNRTNGLNANGQRKRYVMRWRTTVLSTLVLRTATLDSQNSS